MLTVMIRFSAQRPNSLLVAQGRAIIGERALIRDEVHISLLTKKKTLDITTVTMQVPIVRIAFACLFKVNIFNISLHEKENYRIHLSDPSILLQ